jgi:hypothetical protein
MTGAPSGRDEKRGPADIGKQEAASPCQSGLSCRHGSEQARSDARTDDQAGTVEKPERGVYALPPEPTAEEENLR